ncbi:hypothetical protein ACW9HQ_50660, partial [Nocardia gipuzkoensis]
ERVIRNQLGGPLRAGQRRPHIHDGRYFDPEGRLWAVEVELTAKNDAIAQVTIADAYEQAQVASCYGLYYYCRTQAVKNIVSRIGQTVVNGSPNGPKLKLADVDEVIEAAETARAEARLANAIARRAALRVIDGGASDHDQSSADDDDRGVGGIRGVAR